jgi:uncharacterized membrane protein YfcA
MRFHGALAWGSWRRFRSVRRPGWQPGGIRSAAFLGFDLDKRAFVATATATGLIVDAARLPVYLAGQAQALVRVWTAIAVATAGVVLGTLFGGHVLTRLPDRLFRPAIAVVLALLGAGELLAGLRSWRA